MILPPNRRLRKGAASVACCLRKLILITVISLVFIIPFGLVFLVIKLAIWLGRDTGDVPWFLI